MISRNFVRLGFAGCLLVLLSAAASYAQSKSAATPAIVYQDPG